MAETKSRQTLEQIRAAYALQVIRKHEGRPEAREYASLVRSVPSMILQSGLGQTLAFLLAKDEGKRSKPSWHLYDDLQAWLCGPQDPERPERMYPATQQGSDLIKALMVGTRAQYQRAQQVALALLAWMRRFADAYLPSGEDR